MSLRRPAASRSTPSPPASSSAERQERQGPAPLVAGRRVGGTAVIRSRSLWHASGSGRVRMSRHGQSGDGKIAGDRGRHLAGKPGVGSLHVCAWCNPAGAWCARSWIPTRRPSSPSLRAPSACALPAGRRFYAGMDTDPRLRCASVSPRSRPARGPAKGQRGSCPHSQA